MRQSRYPLLILTGALCAAVGVSAVAAEKKEKKAERKAPPKESAEAKRLADEEAEKARKERESRVPEVVKEAERKKDVAQQQGPRISVEDFRRRTEFQVQTKREEQLSTLEQIIKLGPPADELPALLFQKAELYQENSQYFFFQGMEQDDDILKAREAGDSKTQKKFQKEKDDLLSKAKKWTEDSERIYEEIVKKHKKFDRMDQVLYALGRTRWDAGRQKESLDVYRQLIQNHPKSIYVCLLYTSDAADE